MVNVVVAALLLSAVLPLKGVAQGICVIDEMRVQTIRGCVTDPNGLAIAEATIELLKKGGDSTIVAKVMTDENGRFTIPDIRTGRYEIAARYPSLKSLYVPVRVTRRSKVQKEQQEIVIVLNGLMDKPCGGGTAYLRSCFSPSSRRAAMHFSCLLKKWLLSQGSRP